MAQGAEGNAGMGAEFGGGIIAPAGGAEGGTGQPLPGRIEWGGGAGLARGGDASAGIAQRVQNASSDGGWRGAPASPTRMAGPSAERGSEYYDRTAAGLIRDAQATQHQQETQALDRADLAARHGENLPPAPETAARPSDAPPPTELPDAAGVRDMHAKLEPFFDQAPRLEKAFERDPVLYDRLQAMNQQEAHDHLTAALEKSPAEKLQDAVTGILPRREADGPTDPAVDQRHPDAAPRERSLREMREDVGYFRMARERANFYRMVRHELRNGSDVHWESLNKKTEQQADDHQRETWDRFMERDQLKPLERGAAAVKDWAGDAVAHAKEAAENWEAFCNTEAGRRLEYLVTGQVGDGQRRRGN
jgi:hypothetical protein